MVNYSYAGRMTSWWRAFLFFLSGFASARFFFFLAEVFTKEEKESFAYGALSITLECGVRFLTDFLKGDKYFSIDYPVQNLDRARAQLALAKDMEKRERDMELIVWEETREQ